MSPTQSSSRQRLIPNLPGTGSPHAGSALLRLFRAVGGPKGSFHRGRWILAGVLGLFSGNALPAEEGEEPTPSGTQVVAQDPARVATVNLYFENDLFANTDRNYTNGVKLSWISPDLSDYRDSPNLPRWAGGLIRHLPFIHEPGLQRHVVIALGQSIHTPEDITSTSLIPDDQPYAGWLYFAIGLHSQSPTRLDSMEINFGVVGPWSLAKHAQDFVHRVRKLERPLGWHNQLRNEPALNITWERRWRTLAFDFGSSGWGFDSILHLGASLGNVHTYANLGGEWRLGWNLPSDFGTGSIRQAGDTTAPSKASDPRLRPGQWGFHVFAGVDGRAIARDIFLDGNTFRDSHSVDRRPWVGDFTAGAALLVRSWRVSYTQVVRSRQFKQQDGHHAFGSINVAYTY